MVDITYVTIPPINTPPYFAHFLTQSHILTLVLTLSPYESPSFPSFFPSLFWCKKRKRPILGIKS